MIFFAIKNQSYFHIKTGSQRSLTRGLKSKRSAYWLLYFDFLADRTDIANGETDLIKLIDLKYWRSWFLVEKAEEFASQWRLLGYGYAQTHSILTYWGEKVQFLETFLLNFEFLYKFKFMDWLVYFFDYTAFS